MSNSDESSVSCEVRKDSDYQSILSYDLIWQPVERIEAVKII